MWERFSKENLQTEAFQRLQEHVRYQQRSAAEAEIVSVANAIAHGLRWARSGYADVLAELTDDRIIDFALFIAENLPPRSPR